VIRLFVDAPLGAGAVIELATDKAHYLTRVMRLAIGDDIMVFNGADGEWRASLQAVSKHGARLAMAERTREQTSVPDVELIVALIKRARLETIVEKASELGMARVRLITTERTNADHANLARLNLIVAEAAEQCERLEVPSISGPRRLSEVLGAWDPARRLMFCDEAGDAPAAAAALRAAGAGPWAILIGPEGGFSPAERAALRALNAVTPVSLGPRILRADTAAIAAMALWQSSLGDWGT
jgi:16S rRNA (uracil1498-N3)-methyltransferase